MVREQLLLAISRSVEVLVGEHADGSKTVRGLDTATTELIATAVLKFLSDPPLDDGCRNYIAGLYSRRNLEAFVEDIRNKGGIQAMSDTRTGFMCMVDFDWHLGEDMKPARVYSTEADLRRERSCVEQCGIVEVEIRRVRVVQDEREPKWDDPSLPNAPTET